MASFRLVFVSIQQKNVCAQFFFENSLENDEECFYAFVRRQKHEWLWVSFLSFWEEDLTLTNTYIPFRIFHKIANALMDIWHGRKWQIINHFFHTFTNAALFFLDDHFESAKCIQNEVKKKRNLQLSIPFKWKLLFFPFHFRLNLFKHKNHLCSKRIQIQEYPVKRH